MKLDCINKVIDVYKRQVMSRGAKELLTEYNIPAEADELTENIRNRQNTGLCPMECAVSSCGSPEAAYAAILEAVSYTHLDVYKRQLVYISCKPTSLARDLEIFIANGYEVQDVYKRQVSGKETVGNRF